MYELKIYREVMCHENEEWCKIWRRIDFSVQNWHEEFEEFWPEHSKISQSVFYWAAFDQGIWWTKKNTEELCLMALKIDAKFEGKLTCAFKNDMRNLANFHRLKNSDFILESKMVELNQNQNSNQSEQPDAAWKLYFTLQKNE